jgi:hypothetical protein
MFSRFRQQPFVKGLVFEPVAVLLLRNWPKPHIVRLPVLIRAISAQQCGLRAKRTRL